MEPRRIPWPAERIGVCVYGFHGTLGLVAETLLGQGITVSCLATQVAPDAPSGGVEKALSQAGLFEDPYRVGAALGLETVHLPNPHDATAALRLRDAGTNLVLSLSAPILKPEFLDAFDGWVFNFHGSRVFRGRAGLSWNILNGLDRDAVVLHWIDCGIDTGDWVDEDEYRWDELALPIDLMRAQRPSFVRLTERFAERLRQSEIPQRPPPQRLYLPALRTDRDGWIDWRWSAEHVARASRAFAAPYAGASTQLQRAGDRPLLELRLGRCEVARDAGRGLHPLAVGAVLRSSSGSSVVVACGEGAVRIHDVSVDGCECPAGDVARVSMRFRGRT